LELAQQVSSFDMYIDIEIPLLEFCLLLNRVAPYLQYVATNCFI